MQCLEKHSQGHCQSATADTKLKDDDPDCHVWTVMKVVVLFCSEGLLVRNK